MEYRRDVSKNINLTFSIKILIIKYRGDISKIFIQHLFDIFFSVSQNITEILKISLY